MLGSTKDYEDSRFVIDNTDLLSGDTFGNYVFASSFCPPTKLCFFGTDSSSKGVLFLNEHGKLEFSGDLEQSAEVFLEYICSVFNKRCVKE